jgi:hypothetical protein
MDWSIIIIVVGQIATWITILLVYFTLREMRNQRIASQKPDLMIPKTEVYGYSAYSNDPKDDWAPLLIPRFWSKEYLKVMPQAYPHTGRDVTAYNVGFGVAKNITFKWTIECNKIVQQIREYCYQHSIPIVVKTDKDTLRVAENNGETEDYPLSPEHRYEFLMPASITSEGLLFEVPVVYAELVAILIYLKIHHSRKDTVMKELEVEMPSATLELQYDDLQNLHYSKTFDVPISIRYFIPYKTEREGTRNMIFYGSIEFGIKPVN